MNVKRIALLIGVLAVVATAAAGVARATQPTPPPSASCAICHGDTRGANDWTYRTSLHQNNGSGAVPQGVLLNYTFVPDTIYLSAGATLTWYNADGPAHTVTAADGSFDSGRML